jgi:hypothetical protein
MHGSEPRPFEDEPCQRVAIVKAYTAMRTKPLAAQGEMGTYLGPVVGFANSSARQLTKSSSFNFWRSQVTVVPCTEAQNTAVRLFLRGGSVDLTIR